MLPKSRINSGLGRFSGYRLLHKVDTTWDGEDLARVVRVSGLHLLAVLHQVTLISS